MTKADEKKKRNQRGKRNQKRPRRKDVNSGGAISAANQHPSHSLPNAHPPPPSSSRLFSVLRSLVVCLRSAAPPTPFHLRSFPRTRLAAQTDCCRPRMIDLQDSTCMHMPLSYSPPSLAETRRVQTACTCKPQASESRHLHGEAFLRHFLHCPCSLRVQSCCFQSPAHGSAFCCRFSFFLNSEPSPFSPSLFFLLLSTRPYLPTDLPTRTFPLPLHLEPPLRFLYHWCLALSSVLVVSFPLFLLLSLFSSLQVFYLTSLSFARTISYSYLHPYRPPSIPCHFIQHPFSLPSHDLLAIVCPHVQQHHGRARHVRPLDAFGWRL